jgi:hypothetical protein
MENGSTTKVDRFEIDTVVGAYKRLAERVVNGETGVKETAAATKALDGIKGYIKVQLEALRMFEQGSEKAREEAAKILGMETSQPRAIEHANSQQSVKQ